MMRWSKLISGIPFFGMLCFGFLYYVIGRQFLLLGEFSDPPEEITEGYLQDSVLRAFWSITTLFYYCMILVSSIASTYLFFGERTKVFSNASTQRAVLLMLLGAVFACIAGFVGLSGGIGEALYNNARTYSFPRLDVASIMDHSVGAGVFAVWMVVLGCFAIIKLSMRIEDACQIGAYRYFKMHLVVTAFLLSAGILHIFGLYRWLSLFIFEGEVSALVSSGMTFSVSAFYTLFFLVTFMPTFLILKKNAEAWAQIKTKESPVGHRKGAEYLSERGIRLSWKESFGFVSVLSSPLIMGFLTEAVGSLY